jgi:hypothetical protein
VDHWNRDTLDDRRSNLRICLRGQNNTNSRKRSRPAGTSSRFKGVSWRKQKGRWVAKIRKNDSHYFLGYFDSEEDAARAYDAAARRIFGEFARTNFPG